MLKASIPAKFLVPWAQNDSARVEIPVTTSDPTRASQSLGFPPLTEQPPEVGGVPPQGEDFNGGMNQIARAIWWMLQGGGFPYDSAFANASQIGGYASSACIPRADGAGYWLSTADNNTTNPDATDGTAANWVPLGIYGTASITVTSTDVTVYPVQAAFPTLLLSGTLTANRNVILPAWTYEWKIIDNTVRGGFTLTVKTATGSGVVIQTGSQLVRGDGANIVQNPQSIAAPTAGTQAAQLTQVQTGSTTFAVAGGTSDALTATLPSGVTALVNGMKVRLALASANTTTAPTLNVTIGSTATGALTIVKGANAALSAGDLAGAGAEAEFTYNQANNNWVLTNPPASFPAAVNLSGLVSDTTLAVNQLAYLDVAAATTAALHIATGDNQLYEIYGNFSAPTGTGTLVAAQLNPNNAAITNGFRGSGVNSGASLTVINNYFNGFLLCQDGQPLGFKALASTKTLSKMVFSTSMGNNTSNDLYDDQVSVWLATPGSVPGSDTTTAWTSLGTIVFQLAATGRIWVKRIA